MNPEERLEARFSTQARRRPPGGTYTIRVDLESDGQLPETMDQRLRQGEHLRQGWGPWEVHVTATDPGGSLSPWLSEDWWADLIAQAPEDHVTVRFIPSPECAMSTGCLVHPIVLQHVRMLRRVVSRWRLVGCGCADEVRSDEDVRELAGSMYHEIRIQERAGCRTNGDRSESNTPNEMGRATSPRTCEQLFADVRRAQTELGVSTPILIRVPSGDGGEVRPRPTNTPERVEASTPTSTI